MTPQEEQEHLEGIREIQARLNNWIDKTREIGSPAPWPWDADGKPIKEPEQENNP